MLNKSAYPFGFAPPSKETLACELLEYVRALHEELSYMKRDLDSFEADLREFLKLSRKESEKNK